MNAHPLAQWIDDRMSRAEFARQAGTSQTHLHLMLKYERGISLELAVRIEEITQGEFTAARLHSLQDEHLSRGGAEPAGAVP